MGARSQDGLELEANSANAVLRQDGLDHLSIRVPVAKGSGLAFTLHLNIGSHSTSDQVRSHRRHLGRSSAPSMTHEHRLPSAAVNCHQEG